MNEEQIMSTIRSLAMSQGFYGRVLSALEEMKENEPDVYRRNMAVLVAQKFGDAVDLVMYLES